MDPQVRSSDWTSLWSLTLTKWYQITKAVGVTNWFGFQGTCNPRLSGSAAYSRLKCPLGTFGSFVRSILLEIDEQIADQKYIRIQKKLAFLVDVWSSGLLLKCLNFLSQEILKSFVGFLSCIPAVSEIGVIQEDLEVWAFRFRLAEKVVEGYA